MFYIPFFVLLIILIAIIMFKAVKIVPESQVYIVEKLGKYYQSLSSGLSFINPFFDKVSRIVSLKEQVVDFDPQAVITKDNATMQIDTVVYFQITDPKLYTYGVERPLSAIENLTATTLRNIIGDMTVEREKGNIEGVTETIVETDSARMYFDTETKKIRNYVNKKDKYVDSSGFTNEQVSQIATQIVSNLNLSSMVSDISKYSLDKVENFNNEIWVVTFTKKENKDSQIIIGLCPATKELVSLTISE